MAETSTSDAAAHPHTSIMRVAQEWAAAANRDELKAHAAAIWQVMPAADRAAFCQYLGLEAVAAVMGRTEKIDLPPSLKSEAAA